MEIHKKHYKTSPQQQNKQGIAKKKRKSISMLVIVLGFIGLFGASCQFFGERSAVGDGQEIVAKAYNKYLYRTDLENIVTEGIEETDSAELINNYIKNWVMQQVMVKKAEEKLPQNKAEIDKKLKNYRESLVLFSFEQEMLRQNLDTTVTQEQIEEYYIAQKSNFALQDNLLKTRFVIVDNSAPKDSIKTWLLSGKASNTPKLRRYCEEHAKSYSLTSNWYPFEKFTKKIPIKTSSPKKLLSSTKFYKTKDATATYFITIDQYGLKGQAAPLDYKKDAIKRMIINKRRLQYIETLKRETYEQALENSVFEIY